MAQRKLLFASIAIITLGIIGGAAWYVWSTQLRSTDDTASQESSPTENKVQLKTITINGNTFRYPDDDNNKQVIVEDSGSLLSPEIAYAPLRSYFAGTTDKACMNVTAGMMQAGRISDLFGPSSPYGQAVTPTEKQAKVDRLLEDGKAVKQDDLYVLAPSKQNESCAQLAEAKDAKLKIALFEAQEIEKNWLKSLILVR